MGPNFTRDNSDETKFIYETQATVNLVEAMIVHCPTLFPDAKEFLKQITTPTTTTTTTTTSTSSSKEIQTQAVNEKEQEKDKPKEEQKAKSDERKEEEKPKQKESEKEEQKAQEENEKEESAYEPTPSSSSTPDATPVDNSDGVFSPSKQPITVLAFYMSGANDSPGNRISTVLTNHKKLFEDKIAASQPKSREEVEAEVRQGRSPSVVALEDGGAPISPRGRVPPPMTSAVLVVTPGKALNNRKLFEEKIAASQPRSREEVEAGVRLHTRTSSHGHGGGGGEGASAPGGGGGGPVEKLKAEEQLMVTSPLRNGGTATPTTSPIAPPSGAAGGKSPGALASKLGFFEQVAIKEAEAAAKGKASALK